MGERNKYPKYHIINDIQSQENKEVIFLSVLNINGRKIEIPSSANVKISKDEIYIDGKKYDTLCVIWQNFRIEEVNDEHKGFYFNRGE